MNYKKRIETLRGLMAENGLDAMFVGANSTCEYLTGTKRIGECPTRMRQNSLEYAGLLVTEKDAVVLLPRLTGLGILPFIPEDTVLTQRVAYQDEDLTGETFVSVLKGLGLGGKTVGVNRDVTATAVLCLETRLGCAVREASAVIDGMRAVKDADEIALMRRNSEIADRVYQDIMPMVRPGAMVRDLEIEIEKLFAKYGCSGPSFPAEAIVLGPKSGPVFGMNYDRVEKGYTLAFDFGGVFQGYCSDFGRTVFIGEPDAELVKIHGLVMAAQKAGMDAFRDGVSTGEDVNRACRRVIEEAGYGENFIHRMGHGIGKDVHERPFLAMGEKLVTRAGMTFTAEPSIVIVRRCCVRVEDVVLVTKDGCESLSKTTRDIVVVD